MHNRKDTDAIQQQKQPDKSTRAKSNMMDLWVLKTLPSRKISKRRRCCHIKHGKISIWGPGWQELSMVCLHRFIWTKIFFLLWSNWGIFVRVLQTHRFSFHFNSSREGTCFDVEQKKYIGKWLSQCTSWGWMFWVFFFLAKIVFSETQPFSFICAAIWVPTAAKSKQANRRWRNVNKAGVISLHLRVCAV